MNQFNESQQVVGRNTCLGSIHGWRDQPADGHKWVNLEPGTPCVCGKQRYGYCPDCNEHRGTEVFTEGMMAYVHGAYQMLCPCCVLKRQIKHAEEAAASLPKLRTALIAAKCHL